MRSILRSQVSRSSGAFVMLVVVSLLLSGLGAPLVAAQGSLLSQGTAAGSGARGSSVGTFSVLPSGSSPGDGDAQGSIVSGLVASGSASGEGIVRNLSIASGSASGSIATRVFSSVSIEGFQSASQLQGVGTSALQWTGAGVAMTLTDTVNAVLMVKATGDAVQNVSLTTPPGIVVAKDAAIDNVLDVTSQASGAVHGALVLVATGAASQGSSLVAQGDNQVRATLASGAELVFRADTRYTSAASAQTSAAVTSYNAAVVSAMAAGQLSGEATTDFSQGAQLLANLNYAFLAQAHTETSAAHRVTTTLKGQAQATAEACGAASAPSVGANACARADMLAYDLDYIDVPAQTADNVAVYIDGALAQRVQAAAEVATHAHAYWATTVDGRVLVLASAGAEALAASQVTIAAVSDASAAARTLAQLDAQSQLTSSIEGGFDMMGDLATSAAGSGQVIGTFSTFLGSEAKGDAAVRDVTDIRSSTEIFSKIEFAADAAADATASFTSVAQASAAGTATASARAAGGAAIDMATQVDGQTRVVARFTDSVFTTIQAQALAASEVDLHLSDAVGAHALTGTDQVLQLDGPAGKVGYLLLTRVSGGAASASSFDLSDGGVVKARLLAGDALVFRGVAEAQSQASAEVAARAIASGALANEASVGFVANAIASANVNYRSTIHTTINGAAEATHRGQVTLDVASQGVSQAQSAVVSLVADRATLAARDASDVALSVGGQAVATTGTAAGVLGAAAAGGSSAVAFVGTSLQGETQVLVYLPQIVAGQASRVVVQSNLEAQSRLDAALDVFGTFHPGYGGSARGEIVSLVARPDAGLILAYTVAARSDAKATEGTTTQVFDALRLGTSALASASAVSSTALKFENEQGTIEAFDVSSGVLKLTASVATTASFDLATNIVARQISANVIMLSAPDFSGALILAGAAGGGAGESALGIAGDGTAVVNASLDAGTEVIFKAFSGFESQLTEAQREAQAQAIASGELLGQVIVGTNAQTHVTTATAVNYYPDIGSGAVVGNVLPADTAASVSPAGYGAVQAITQVASADKVELVVSSATHTGKSIVLSLDRNTVRGLVNGDARLMVDGHALTQASSYEDALVANADKYYLITSGGEAGLQALVTLSHFSTRTITLESPQAPSLFLWTTLGLAIVVVGQAVYPRLKRKSG